ncbi:MAG: allantoinase PuuE, partial [Pseudomonadota bacterium]
LAGYGARVPDAQWPNGAKIAVQFVLNYEEGGENNLLHGDPASEAFLSEIVGAAAWEGQRHWNMETIYEYGARAGFWRLHRMFTKFNVPVTVYGVATGLARSPDQVLAMQDANWEIASHGLKWIEHKDMSEDEERAQMAEAIRLHTEVTGARPRGWYTGRCSINTVRLAAEEGGFAYVADSYADDLPYWSRFEDRDQLIVPYTLDANDMRFATPQGFNSGEQFFQYLKDSFDALYNEGIAGQPKMMSIGLHCRLAGRPGRAEAVKSFLKYLQNKDMIWYATREAIADHWAVTHPPVHTERPSQMSKDAFVSKFGGVFEHSRWVAERAHGLELGPAHDTVAGVHSALCRAFRSANPDERMAVLRAHPDLAGKLAQAERLTPESTAEQASAGLDALTDLERSTFEGYNAEYTQKFGFPFIIAVRDYKKPGILEAFDRRLSHDTETEFREACRQVERIAYLRLTDMM